MPPVAGNRPTDAQGGRGGDVILANIAAPDEDQVRALVRAAHAAVPLVEPHLPSARCRHLAYLRNVAIVETLRATGLRVSELLALRRADLDGHSQTATAPDGRTLYFDLESWAALSRYLAARGDSDNHPLFHWNQPLFARHDRASLGQPLQPLHRETVRCLLATLSPEPGLGARALRTRFAHRVLAATGDQAGTAHLLGLTKPSSLRRYAPDEP